MSDLSGLIECPICAKVGKRQILGRILDNGYFAVRRFHHGSTIICANNYTVSCACGYTCQISSGTIVVNHSQINGLGMAII